MPNQFNRRNNRNAPTSAKEALPSPSLDTKKLTFLIDAELHQELHVTAIREGRTMTDIITTLITDYLHNKQQT